MKHWSKGWGIRNEINDVTSKLIALWKRPVSLCTHLLPSLRPHPLNFLNNADLISPQNILDTLSSEYRVSVLHNEEFWRLVAQCECTPHYWIIHLKMVKTVNFVLCVFYYNFFKCPCSLVRKRCGCQTFSVREFLMSVLSSHRISHHSQFMGKK